MCFSTEVSFTAAVVLYGAGIMTIKNCSSKHLIPLAATPFLFATQQLSEGFLWLHLSGLLPSTAVFEAAIRLFLVFAFLVWPIWIPLSLAIAETINSRKWIIMFFAISGIGLSLWNLSYAFNQTLEVQIVNHSIQYVGYAPPQTWIYPIIVLAPCFISSLRSMWIFGLLTAVGYAVAEYTYSTTFVSVWCFFAAVVSAIIYRVVKDNASKERENSLIN